MNEKQYNIWLWYTNEKHNIYGAVSKWPLNQNESKMALFRIWFSSLYIFLLNLLAGEYKGNPTIFKNWPLLGNGHVETDWCAYDKHMYMSWETGVQLLLWPVSLYTLGWCCPRSDCKYNQKPKWNILCPHPMIILNSSWRMRWCEE